MFNNKKIKELEQTVASLSRCASEDYSDLRHRIVDLTLRLDCLFATLGYTVVPQEQPHPVPKYTLVKKEK